MNGQDLAFAAAAVFALVNALGMVFQRSAIYAALHLIGVLIAVAVIFALLHAPFLAVIEVVLYAGAVVVLFLFVIMLLDLRHASETDRAGFKLFPALVAASIGGVTVWAALNSPALEALSAPPPVGAEFGGVPQAGQVLLTSYAFSFELVSVLLLAAIVAAVALAGKPRASAPPADHAPADKEEVQT